MKLTYIASACVVVEHLGVRVLCDPWLTQGIYGGAWFHVPDLTVRPEDFADVDAIYLSHIHPDHADFATLERIPRSIRILVASYAENFLAKRLRGMGFTVHELPHDAPFPLGSDFTIQIIPADNCNPEACGQWIGCPIPKAVPGLTYQIDSLAVFKGGGRVICNVNDVPYQLGRSAIDRVKQAYGHVDLLLVGYAGAGPYPQCFDDLTLEQKQGAAQAKKQSFLQQGRAFIDHLKPAYYLPFAGQYTLGGSLVDLNPLRGVPELEDLDVLNTDGKMIRLNRNSWWDCETAQASKSWQPRDMAYIGRCVERLREKKLDHEQDEWPYVTLLSLMTEAEAALQRRCAERGYMSKWILNVCATVGAERIEREVQFPHLKEGSMMFPTPRPWFRIRADARLWYRILTRKAHLNNCEIGSLLRISREPKTYDRGVWHHASYFHV